MRSSFSSSEAAALRSASAATWLLALGALGCSWEPSEPVAVGTTEPVACVGTPVVVAKRVVRLTKHQLFGAYEQLFGAEGAMAITQNEERPAPTEREFPPISGEIGIGEALVAVYDRLARSAMRYVVDNSATLTACGPTAADAGCVQQYLLAFAERAFRHPLSAEERDALTGPLWAEMSASGATSHELLGYGVYAILSSPSFLYRTEFGPDANVAGPLSPYELATALSLFLTDRPPDAKLLAAASSGALATPDEARTQAFRLLETPEARTNLETAFARYLALTNAPSVILNTGATPGLSVTRGLQASIFREGELFLKHHLWSGALSEMLTSRQTWTRPEIATQIYGVLAPSEVDADGFGVVELPPDRSGLLTLSTFLLAGARSTGGSPVARGLRIHASMLCGSSPSFPAELRADPGFQQAIASLGKQSELEQAAYRAERQECAGCHQQFDAFGMVLEPYDAVGRQRSTDLEGRPIDERWTTFVLPASAGGTLVASAAELGQALATSGAFERCLAMSFINFALTDVSRGGAHNTAPSEGPPTASCAVQQVVASLAGSDHSFTSLLGEVSASDTMRLRSRGE